MLPSAVNIRVAEHDGRLYLDLADEHWRAVAIGPDGWRVLGCPLVRFRRPPGMLALPIPERGGSIEALRPFLNLSDQNDFVLVVAWLQAALRPGGPFPLLAISGEQGSAKADFALWTITCEKGLWPAGSSFAPTQPIAKPRSRASSTQTRLLRAWGAHGQSVSFLTASRRSATGPAAQARPSTGRLPNKPRG